MTFSILDKNNIIVNNIEAEPEFAAEIGAKFNGKGQGIGEIYEEQRLVYHMTSEVKIIDLEFGKDTIYERSNFIETDGIWEYDEIRYTYPEYIKIQQENQETIMLALAELAKED